MLRNSIDYLKFNIEKDDFEFWEYLEKRNLFVNSIFQAKNTKITDFGTVYLELRLYSGSVPKSVFFNVNSLMDLEWNLSQARGTLSLYSKHKDNDEIDRHRDKSERHSKPCPFFAGYTQFAGRNNVRDVTWNQHSACN